jgi:hypothetical protein
LPTEEIRLSDKEQAVINNLARKWGALPEHVIQMLWDMAVQARTPLNRPRGNQK